MNYMIGPLYRHITILNHGMNCKDVDIRDEAV